MRYRVMSSYRVEEDEERKTIEAVEVVRTDKDTAKNDAQLIRAITHRNAWIEEIEK